MKFIESICLKEGDYLNLEIHQQRVRRTFETFFEGAFFELKKVLPIIQDSGSYKVRVVYDNDTVDVDYASYQKRDIRKLELVNSNPFDYSFKYEDRAAINQLKATSLADDIIIVMDGFIRDSSYSNLAFWDGEKWLTPEKPLLEGVRRSQLLSEEKIKPSSIKSSDINKFEKVSLINAMLDLNELSVPISSVIAR